MPGRGMAMVHWRVVQGGVVVAGLALLFGVHVYGSVEGLITDCP